MIPMVYEDEEKKQYMVIKIKKPHHAERLAWIIFVALLLSVVLFQWINWPDEDYCPDEDEETLTVTGKQTAPVESTPQEERKEKESPPIGEAIPVEEKPEDKELSGNVEFTIDEVAVAKTKSELGKITSVTYSIENRKVDFVPLVRMHIFDSQWKEDSYTPKLLARCCEDKPLFDLPLKAGAPALKHTFTPNFPSLTNLEETKTVKIEVYDKADTATPLASGEYVLTKSSWE